MSSRFRIIIPTKQSQEEYKQSVPYKHLESLQKVWDASEDSVEVCIVENNTTGLSELYQRILDSSHEYDYVLFIHDDLEIHDHFVCAKLIKAHETYDIVGLAGAESQDYSLNVPAVWHLSKKHPGHGRGIVGHVIPKGFQHTSKTYINSAFFGPTPGKVVVIDGLFMSFKMSSVKNSPVLFNSKYTFHHYDMAMCVNAYDCGLDIGVWPIYCVHYGLGEFDTDPLWRTLSVEFKKDYGTRKLQVR